MKFSRLSLLALIPALMLFVSTSASAQAPDGQLGIQAGTAGLGLQFALSPSLHIGGTVQILAGDVAATTIGISPYARFLLEGEVNPFFQAGLNLTSVSPDVGSSSTTTSIYAAFGLEWFHNENVGIAGQVSFFRLGLDPSSTVFGPVSGDVSVEYYMN